MMMLYNPIGKTLAEIRKDCRFKIGGYAVFVLQDENDHILDFSKEVQEDE